VLCRAANRPWFLQQVLHAVERARARTARSPARRPDSLHKREIADSSQLTAQFRGAWYGRVEGKRAHIDARSIHASSACV